MQKIFVIGNIGSGKSTFCQYLGVMLGVAHTVVINLDKLGHDALRNAEVQAAIKAAFGPVGTREELAKIAFSDATNLNKLNQITHPQIMQNLAVRLQEADQASLQFAIVEQTAVAEKDDAFLKLADTIVCVTSPKIYSETPDRVNAQLSGSQLQSLADIVVKNNGDLAALKTKAHQVAKQISQQIAEDPKVFAATSPHKTSQINSEEN